MEPLTDALSRFGESVSALFAEHPILAGVALALVVAIWALQTRLSKTAAAGQGPRR